MALKKCKECKKDVSSKADLCPHCGAKQKRSTIGCGSAIFIIIVLGFIGSQFSSYTQKAEETKNSIRQAEVKKQQAKKQQNAKKAFEDNIENHYAELVKLVGQQQVDAASGKINLFNKFQPPRCFVWVVITC